MNKNTKSPATELTIEGPNTETTGLGVTDTSRYFKTARELRENQSQRFECAVCRGRFREEHITTVSPPGGRVDVCIACLPNPPEEWL